MEQLGSYWTNVPEVRNKIGFWKSVEKIQILLKSENNNEYLRENQVYIFDHISFSSS